MPAGMVDYVVPTLCDTVLWVFHRKGIKLCSANIGGPSGVYGVLISNPRRLLEILAVVLKVETLDTLFAPGIAHSDR